MLIFFVSVDNFSPLASNVVVCTAVGLPFLPKNAVSTAFVPSGLYVVLLALFKDIEPLTVNTLPSAVVYVFVLPVLSEVTSKV